MVKLANTYGSGPYVARLAGSSPVTRTIAQSLMYQGFGRFLLAKKKLSQQKSRCITLSCTFDLMRIKNIYNLTYFVLLVSFIFYRYNK